MANGEMEIRYGLGHQGAHPYHSKAADHQVTPNDTARPNGGALPHESAGRVRSSGSADRSRCKSSVVARSSQSFVKIVPACTLTPSSIVTDIQM
jgi:hypothetical protein